MMPLNDALVGLVQSGAVEARGALPAGGSDSFLAALNAKALTHRSWRLA